jgi:outer membrane lipoprotein-sorting protein
MMSRSVLAAALALCLPGSGLAQTVDELVARNTAARGGAAAWRAVSSLKLTGRMDVGKGMLVPYVLEQKRPTKMRLEYVFDDATVIQCSDGKTGWKVAPFRGKTTPEPLTKEELREAAGSADLYGLLFDYARRGHSVAMGGRESIEGREAFKLQVTLPGGAVRWVYLDAESGLEVRVDALRKLAGRERRVETFYRDWQAAEGLLIPRRYETRTEGAKEPNLLTVETVLVNPPIDDSRFVMLAAAPPPAGGRK